MNDITEGRGEKAHNCIFGYYWSFNAQKAHQCSHTALCKPLCLKLSVIAPVTLSPPSLL